jgi:acid phosphatase (class A)
VDRRRLILTGAAGLVSACATPAPATPPGPAGDDRLLFAQAHLELRPELAAQHFDCAIGARLTARPLPGLTGAFQALAEVVAVRIPRDMGPASGGVCIRLIPGEGVQRGPSRRAALVEAYAQALRRLAPDRDAAIAARAGDIADAEVLCGLAGRSDVDQGRIAGREAFDVLFHTRPAFRALMDQAAVEISGARRDPVESPACAAERRSLSPLPDAG